MVGNNVRDSLKSSQICGQSAAKPSLKEAEGSTVRESTLSVFYSTEQLAEMYNQGMSMNQIANAVGLCSEAVRKRFKKAGIKTRNQKQACQQSKRNTWPDEQIKEWYESGMSTTEIAAKISRSVGGVYGKLQRMGVLLRDRGQGVRLYRASKQPGDSTILWDKNKITELYVNQRKSTYEIADIIGCHRAAVMRACNRFGIPMRKAVRKSRDQMVLVWALRKVGVKVPIDCVDQRIPGSLYCGDIVFPANKIIVEVDGFFHTEEADRLHGDNRVEKDKIRDAKLLSLGWTTVRVLAKEVTKDAFGAANKIANLLRGNLHECGTPHRGDDMT